MIKFDSSNFQKVSAYFRVLPISTFFDEPVDIDVLQAVEADVSIDAELAALLSS